MQKRVEMLPLNEHLEVKRGVTSVCLSIFIEILNDVHWNLRNILLKGLLRSAITVIK